jgi:hypothetical protein
MISSLISRVLAYALAAAVALLCAVWFVYVPTAEVNAVARALADDALRREQAASRRRSKAADKSTAVLVQALHDSARVRVVQQRVRALCQPASKLPTATGGADGTAAQAEDAEFTDALEDDLATCHAELARFQALQAWYAEE